MEIYSIVVSLQLPVPLAVEGSSAYSNLASRAALTICPHIGVLGRHVEVQSMESPFNYLI
jgi:hypothetical protein